MEQNSVVFLKSTNLSENDNLSAKVEELEDNGKENILETKSSIFYNQFGYQHNRAEQMHIGNPPTQAATRR